MTEQKLTPTQKLKLAEAEISKLKQLIHKLQDEHFQELQTQKAEYGNEQYTIGYQEGYNEAAKLAAAQRAEAGIARFFRK